MTVNRVTGVLISPIMGGFLLCVLLGVAPHVHGDEEDKERDRFFRPSPRFWSFEMEFSSGFNSNILENEEELDSYGLVVGGVLRGEKRAGSHLFRTFYKLNLRSYSATNRWDRATHDLAVMFFEQLGPRLNAGVIGGYSLRAFTEDRYLSNQPNLWAQLEYRSSRWFRLGVHGALRWIHFEDSLRDERVRLVGAEVGGRIGRSSVWDLGYRYEKNDAGNIYRSFDRSRFWAGYGLRLGDRDTLEIEVEQRRRRFRELTVRVDSETIFRKELIWTPSVSWSHLFGQGRWLRFSYALRKRRSNDPRKSFEAHRFEATVRFPVTGRSHLTGRARAGIRPWPRPPKGAEVSESNLLDLILLYSERENHRGPDGGSFTVSSHWKDLLAAQGTPTKVSKRPVFNEELWFYGSSSVVLRNGLVTSWHNAGNLRAVASPKHPPRPTTEARRITVRRRQTSLSAAATKNRLRSAVETKPVDDGEPSKLSSHAEPRRVDESLPGAVKRLTKTEVVLKDGTRLPGILKRYDNGLAYIILLLDNRRTMLTTLPEDLVDKEASQKRLDP
jgi:hypothetical protein